jgi:hypothetical protein
LGGLADRSIVSPLISFTLQIAADVLDYAEALCA